MKKLLIFLSAIFLFNSTVYADTFIKDKITIFYDSKLDLEIAKDAIEWVDNFFIEQFHKDLNPTAIIEFKNEVFVEFKNKNYIMRARVYGTCNRTNNKIEMTTWTEDWLRERKMFNLNLTKELHKSVMVHELAHLYLNELMEDRYYLLTHASHEFFAYTTQLIFLALDTSQKVLSQYSSEFDNPRQINVAFHDIAPHRYGVYCYKWYIKHKKKHLHLIVSREFIAHDLQI